MVNQVIVEEKQSMRNGVFVANTLSKVMEILIAETYDGACKHLRWGFLCENC